MRALRKLASQVDTAAALGLEAMAGDKQSYAPSFGRGAGDVRVPGRISTWSSGTDEIEPLVVFNTLPYTRSEMVVTKVWGRDWPRDRIVVVDDRGNKSPGQVVGISNDVGHTALNVMFRASGVPAMGYRTYGVWVAPEPAECEKAIISTPYGMENEFYSIRIDPSTGAIASLIEKITGLELVPKGTLIGLLEMYQEVPHLMTAWDIGRIARKRELREGLLIDETDKRDSRDGDSLGMVFSIREQQRGPQRVSCRTLHKVNDSRVRIEIALAAGSPMIEIIISVDWNEIGNPDTGVPMLKLALPFGLTEPAFTTEIPFGSQKRPADGKEIPALRWVDLSTSERGFTLVNDCKYGFSADNGTLRSTLIRSTYDPDAHPELGHHEMAFALIPHTGPCDGAAATRVAESFAQPMCVVGTAVHGGQLPPSASQAEVLNSNISLAALKRAEDSDALIVRLYETAGVDTEARVRLNGIVKPNCKCFEVDLMEQVIPGHAARVEDDTLIVKLSGHSVVTVLVD